MPRYYFDVTDAGGFHCDAFGDDFDDIEAARVQCHSLLSDIAREELPDGDLHSVRCDVRDETGRFVYRGELTYRKTSHPA